MFSFLASADCCLLIAETSFADSDTSWLEEDNCWSSSSVLMFCIDLLRTSNLATISFSLLEKSIILLSVSAETFPFFFFASNLASPSRILFIKPLIVVMFLFIVLSFSSADLFCASADLLSASANLCLIYALKPSLYFFPQASAFSITFSNSSRRAWLPSSPV